MHTDSRNLMFHALDDYEVRVILRNLQISMCVKQTRHSLARGHDKNEASHVRWQSSEHNQFSGPLGLIHDWFVGSSCCFCKEGDEDPLHSKRGY